MASNQIDFIGEYWPWILFFITVGGTLYAGIRWIFCKGKQKADDDNWKKQIKDEILLLNKKIVDLQDEFDQKESKAIEVHGEIKEGISKINGILETMQKSLER